MHVTIKKDSLKCDCGSTWVLKGEYYECPGCGEFRDKNIILAITKNDESENKT